MRCPGDSMDVKPDSNDVEREAQHLWSSYWANWLAARSLRILMGVAILATAYGYHGRLFDLAGKPVSTLSIDDLGVIIGYSVCGLVAFVVSFLFAFGPSFERIPASLEDFRSQAVENRSRLEKYYAKSRLLGWLLDRNQPTFGFKQPWKATLVQSMILVGPFLLSLISMWFSPVLAATFLALGIALILLAFILGVLRGVIG